MRRTKIVCTIGPATNSDEQLEKLMLAGMNVARLNFSHGTQEGHAKVIASIRAISKRLNVPVAILQDLQGPKIRTGLLEGGQPVRLVDGAQIAITSRDIVGTAECVATTYQQLPQDVKVGDRILLDDGLLELRVIGKDATDVRCEVVHGGLLKEHKGINLPGVAVSAPSLTQKDLEDLKFGVRQGVDYVALSFVRKPEDILATRQQIEAIQAEFELDCSNGPIPLIAKLEKPEAVKRLDEILRVTDGVMVARGDLGVEMAPETVPLIQKHIIARCNDLGLPVITATQMLESMITNPRPTRAEASDVANAILDGTDAVMLSAETAAGAYPIDAVKMMDRIARQTESEGLTNYQRHAPLLTQDRAVCHAAKALAEEASVRYITVFTRSGASAQLISKDRPRTPVMAYTPSESVYHRLCLWWGVWPHIIPLTGSTEELIDIVEKKLQAEHEIQEGDSIVIMGGMPVASRMRTNFVRLHHIGEQP
ncbi:pyruvate kinase [Dictyobacter vulcani]|uniref:Pyruvate kinase n=1 Tax=Dictyobacter vulcani TaxID=2607529 RepID=A0A5J4KVQ3_9CHLR|nr:pyruvate kinase [Dictyobacter vulcani]GER92045.1 pyruvate kinase [Dictyobacter vulcani]